MTKGVSTRVSYTCNRCKMRYSSEREAKECFDKGLPKILKPGKVFQRGDEYFAVHFLTDKPNAKTHERNYVVGAFPDRVRDGYEFVQATASFDGHTLHTIQGAHSRGGYFSIGDGPAVLIEDSQLKTLLEREEFCAFQQKAASFGRK